MVLADTSRNQPLELPSSRLEQVEMLKAILVARATGSGDQRSPAQYRDLRILLMADANLRDRLPRFVRTHRTLDEFWGFIKLQSETYAGRREVLRKEFEDLLSELESSSEAAMSASMDVTLELLESTQVRKCWDRATQRLETDPEGAITAARALLESVCKHILVDGGVQDVDDHDLPALYDMTSKSLGLAPSQHTAEAFKRILGGCTMVVHHLATLRNRLGDAHGKAPMGIRPAVRHARLAVNLAGAMATFLVETFEDRQSKTDLSNP